jgi:glycosyltransferase involved in cell wall biosynthesis
MSAKTKNDSVSTLSRRLARRMWHSVQMYGHRVAMPKVRPCVVIFPSDQPWSSSSNLRAWLVAPELRKLGWRAVIVPQPLSLSQRLRILRLERPDVILLQQTRHALNDPELYRPYPCVLDIDDADFLDPRYQSSVISRVRAATTIVAGSRFVAENLGKYNPSTHVIWTCTPEPAGPPETPPDMRAPVVAWAHAEPLRYPHEADLIRRVMTEVVRRTQCTFWLFGSREDDAREWLEPLRRSGGTCEAIPLLSYPNYLARVSRAAVGLQPVCTENEFSRGRSFGKLLAYLSGQVAVVASNNVDHPHFFRNGENGFLANDDHEWISSIHNLMENPVLRRDVAIGGWNDFQVRLTTRKFAALLDGILRPMVVRGGQTCNLE